MLRWGRQAIEGRVLSARGVKQHIIFSTSDDGAKKAIAVGLHADELQRLLKAAACLSLHRSLATKVAFEIQIGLMMASKL